VNVTDNNKVPSKILAKSETEKIRAVDLPARYAENDGLENLDSLRFLFACECAETWENNGLFMVMTDGIFLSYG
jgi:hypothetical protein